MTIPSIIKFLQNIERECEHLRDELQCHKSDEVLAEWQMDEWNWIQCHSKGDGRSEVVCVRPDKSNFDGDEIYLREKSFEFDTEIEGVDAIRKLKQLFALLNDDPDNPVLGLTDMVTPVSYMDVIRWIEAHFDPKLNDVPGVSWNAWELDDRLKELGRQLTDEDLEDL